MSTFATVDGVVVHVRFRTARCAATDLLADHALSAAPQRSDGVQPCGIRLLDATLYVPSASARMHHRFNAALIGSSPLHAWLSELEEGVPSVRTRLACAVAGYVGGPKADGPCT